MKQLRIACFVGVSVGLVLRMSGQSNFQNLDFEDATIVYGAQGAYASDALPGWTAYLGGAPQTYILYNDVPLSDAAVALLGPGSATFGFVPIAGNYSLMLWGEFNPEQIPVFTNCAAISQTGQISASTKSISFWGTIGGMQVTFNGQALSFAVIGSTATYNIYAADISRYAGQTGQLLFNNPPYSNTTGGPATLDNIQFSDQPAPEPTALTLLSISALCLGWRIKRSKQPEG
jgi:hypothetical protein